MDVVTKTSALSRLRALVEAVEQDPESTKAWKEYVKVWTLDVPDLSKAGTAVSLLLLRLASAGEKGSGWKAKAELIRDVVIEERRGNAGPVDIAGMDIGDDKRPRKTLSNVERVLSTDPSWVGQIRLNELSDRVEIGGEPSEDTKVTEVSIALDRSHSLSVEDGMTGKVLRLVAKRHAYHPVREYLTALEWDGTKRVHSLLGEYLQCATPDGEQRVPGDDGSPLLESLSRRWMVSAVARAMRLGCKVDTVLILQGKQGHRKGTAIRTLGGADWVRSSLLEIGDKDVYQQIRGAWIYEIQEIDGMLTRKHAADLKAFVSEHKDSYRRPYGTDVEDVPRGCVFVGTTNSEAMLTDPTGSRRFWPVTVTKRIDVDRIAADRDQLWAEAVQLYRDGLAWHLTDDEEAALIEASEVYRTGDVWEGYVCDFITKNPGGDFTTADVLNSMQIAIDKQGEAAEARVRRILTSYGYASKRKRDPGGERSYRWVKGSA